MQTEFQFFGKSTLYKGSNMFVVYILHSPLHAKIYIGFTSNLEQRLLSHNKLGIKGWTIKYRPWILAYSEKYESKSEAMKREKFLKTAAGRRFVYSILEK